MSRCFVIVGTDTGVGKTIFSAALVGVLGAFYWKPVQAGLEEETDSQIVARLSGAAFARILPEAWRLKRPMSPHLAARFEGVEIDIAQLTPPRVDGNLVIETAGGVMTPLTDDVLTADVLARWRLPTILVARTTLGTINHSLLTIEALRRRNVALIGVVFVGGAEPDVEQTIASIGCVRRLGRLPHVAPLHQDSLKRAFDAAFDLRDFA